MRYFKHNAQSIEHMLSVVNKKSVDELFASIPKSERLDHELSLAPARDELQIKRELMNFYKAPDLLIYGRGRH